jgi:hypothetical protein
MIGTTAALITLGSIAAGSTVANGMIGSRGAKRAAEAGSRAADEAGQKVWKTVEDVNPSIGEWAHNASVGVEGAANNAATDVLGATRSAQEGMTNARDTANSYLHPYMKSGQESLDRLSEQLGPDGRYEQMLDEKFSFDPDSDPAYQFVLEQGKKAIQKSAAARGGLMSSGAVRSLNKYAAGHASGEYSKQFDRFQTDRDNRGKILNDMSGHLRGVAGMGLEAGVHAGGNDMDAATYTGNVGMQGAQYAGNMRTKAAEYTGNMNYDAANVMANNTIGAAKYVGDARMQRGNAEASGHMGTANAWGNALQNGANTVSDAVVLGSELNPYGRRPINTTATRPGPAGDWATYKAPVIDYSLGRRTGR